MRADEAWQLTGLTLEMRNLLQGALDSIGVESDSWPAYFERGNPIFYTIEIRAPRQQQTDRSNRSDER